MLTNVRVFWILGGTVMNAQGLDALTQQVDQLDADAKLELLAHLVDSLRRQIKAEYRPLLAYYGVGRGQGFGSAEEVDTFLAEERAQWER
jgi:hypothetical protein